MVLTLRYIDLLWLLGKMLEFIKHTWESVVLGGPWLHHVLDANDETFFFIHCMENQ